MGQSFQAIGFHVFTVCKDEDAIRKDIKAQEQEDRRIDQISFIYIQSRQSPPLRWPIVFRPLRAVHFYQASGLIRSVMYVTLECTTGARTKNSAKMFSTPLYYKLIDFLYVFSKHITPLVFAIYRVYCEYARIGKPFSLYVFLHRTAGDMTLKIGAQRMPDKLFLLFIERNFQ